jgi:acetyl/propionyl-CoA carboxylase alpha subunit
MSETDGREGLVGTIPTLLRRMHDSRVTSLDVRVGGARLAVRTYRGAYAVGEANLGEGLSLADDVGLHSVVSPLSGVAYYSPGPEQPPYVAIGDVVRAGQVVALVEAMKVFNEIHTDRGGRVVRLCVTPGDVVTSGTPLLLLEPDDRPTGED